VQEPTCKSAGLTHQLCLWSGDANLKCKNELLYWCIKIVK
jgi:hypothetical protein